MENIIGLFGVPRSGTSWIGQIFNSSPDTRFAYQPMFSEKFRDKIHVRSTEPEMRRYFQEIYNTQEDFLSQNDNKEKPERMEFQKNKSVPEMLVFKEVMFFYMIPQFLRNLPEMRVILILRNPVDVLKSWYNAPREFYPEWDIEDEWLFAQSKNAFLPERYYGYAKWKEYVVLVNEMLKKYPDRVYAVKL